MSAEVRVLGAALLGVVVTLAATPAAVRFARRMRFYDKPHGYKSHARATPYLGGAAVMVGFVSGAVAFGGGAGRYATIVAGACVLWMVGTLDDRRTVSPLVRVLITAAIAVALWEAGFGWAVSDAGAVNLILTVLWVVGLVNSLNLLDNMDGATSSVACVSSLGLGTLSLVDGNAMLAALALAMAGACFAFLRYNLERPARIFLGDGGSMPIGFLIAAVAVASSRDDPVTGWPTLLGAVLLAGVPILDTTLVIVSRARRRVSLLTGGRDHVTHRLRCRLPSARHVSLTLGVGQLALATLAVTSIHLGAEVVWAAASAYALALAAAVIVLERPAWTAPHNEADQSEPASAAIVRVG